MRFRIVFFFLLGSKKYDLMFILSMEMLKKVGIK